MGFTNGLMIQSMIHFDEITFGEENRYRVD